MLLRLNHDITLSSQFSSIVNANLSHSRHAVVKRQRMQHTIMLLQMVEAPKALYICISLPRTQTKPFCELTNEGNHIANDISIFSGHAQLFYILDSANLMIFGNIAKEQESFWELK